MKLTVSKHKKSERIIAAILILVFASVFVVEAQNGGEPVTFVKCGEMALEDVLTESIVTARGRVFMIGTGGLLVAVDDGNYETLWKAELGGEFASRVVGSGDLLFVVNNSKSDDVTREGTSVFRAINVSTGLTHRSHPLPFSPRFELQVLGDRVAVIGSSGTVSLVGSEAGQSTWDFRSDVTFAGPAAINESLLIVAKASSGLVILDALNGTHRTDISTVGEVTAIAFLDDEAFSAADDRGNIFRAKVNASDAEWTFKSGGGVRFLHVVDGDLFALSNDNFFYRFSGDSGKVIWRKRLAGRITIRPLFAGGQAFVAVLGESTVIVTEIEKGKTVGAMRLNEQEFPTSSVFITSSGLFGVPGSSKVNVFQRDGCSPIASATGNIDLK